MVLGIIIIVVIGLIIAGIASGIKSTHIVSVYNTGQSHYYRGTCMICFEIRYDDGKTEDIWVQYDTSQYHFYDTWNEKYSKK